MSEMKKRNIVIGAVIAMAVVAVVAVKMLVKNEGPDGGKISAGVASSGSPSVYLFYDAQDRDEGCRSIYDAFDRARSAFPKDIQSSKVNVGENEPLFEKYGVRVLPTVLFVDGKGIVRERIEGEGGEVERRLSTAFAGIQDVLKP